MSSRAAALALASLLGGCILFVSPESGGDHCAFAGADTGCGGCIRAQCQHEVDLACAAGRDGVLGALDACATKRDATCDALESDTSSPEASTLAACVKRACPGACAENAGTSTTRCAAEPFGDGRECSCTTASPPNDYVCAEAAIEGTICCAPHGWPAPGLSCACLPLGCAPNATGCSCFLTTYQAQSDVCEGQTCCADHDSCQCGTRPCRGGEVQVSSCTIAAVGCGDGQERVASCSVRE